MDTGDKTWTALEAYHHIFNVPQDDANDAAMQNEELKALYTQLCARQHNTTTLKSTGALYKSFKNFDKNLVAAKRFRRSLWDALIEAHSAVGQGPIWRPRSPTVPAAPTAPAVPAYMSIVTVTPGMLTETRPGDYKWGQFTASASSAEEAAVAITQKWAQVKVHKLDSLATSEARAAETSRLLYADQATRPGTAKLLKHKHFKEQFRGRLWQSDDKWVFQEDGTPCRVEVTEKTKAPFYAQADWVEHQLYKAVRAEHVKASQKINQDTLKQTFGENLPRTAGDLAVRGTTEAGKLIYEWRKTEVVVTPRKLRAAPDAAMSQSLQGRLRETTPARAMRKMREALRRAAKKTAKGTHAAIVVKYTPADIESQPTAPCDDDTAARPQHAAAIATNAAVHDARGLGYVRDAYEFLNSMRLQYCRSCDEEWPVFDVAWPQAGVEWAGPEAGRCETIERAGFEAAWATAGLCSRCEGQRAAYAKMFCAENLQHLGPRHKALSNLTWYESLLIARVHPVVSVITLTSTGLLCYAGHVCNYFVKILEWITELPAVLRDKNWFLIKRRRSIGKTQGETAQKKPTTANRRRLEAAIAEARRYMPRIYAGSFPNTTALEKFPVEGEQEMSDVHGVVLRHFERKKLTQADHVSVFSLFQFICYTRFAACRSVFAVADGVQNHSQKFGNKSFHIAVRQMHC